MVRTTARTALVGTALVVGMAVGACSSTESTTDDETAPAPPRTPGAANVEPPSDPAPAGPAPRSVTQLIGDALRRDGNLTRRQLVRRLGAPTGVEHEPVTNTYDPEQIDTLRTLRYPGLSATVYDVTREPKAFLIRLTVTGARYESPEGLRVGTSAQAVVDRVGPPTERRAGGAEWVYRETGSTPTAMIVSVDDGRVAQIVWEFYFS
jgi:hypothetical protein